MFYAYSGPRDVAVWVLTSPDGDVVIPALPARAGGIPVFTSPSAAEHFVRWAASPAGVAAGHALPAGVCLSASPVALSVLHDTLRRGAIAAQQAGRSYNPRECALLIDARPSASALFASTVAIDAERLPFGPS